MTSEESPARTKHLPCRVCDRELFGADAEETTTYVHDDSIKFGGKTAIKEVPALICPDCEEVTPL